MKAKDLKVIILIGPKGAGKSYIGKTLQAQMKIPFLNLEPVFIGMYAQGATNSDCYRYVEIEVERVFLDGEKSVCFETTAVADEFAPFLERLNLKYRVLLIKVEAPLDSCWRRVMGRPKEGHLPVSQEQVQEFNQLADQVCLDWTVSIDNSGPASEEEILSAIRKAGI